MKQPEFPKKPSFFAVFALTIIALLVFLATGALLIGTNSLSDPDVILSMELNTLKSQVKDFRSAPPPQPETPENTPVEPESRTIHVLPGGLFQTAWK